MRLVKGNSLAETEVLQKGQEVDLIEVEDEADWLKLEKNILEGGLYDEQYFAEHGGLGQPIYLEKFFLACLLSGLRPRRLLDLGAGAGDVPLLIKLAGGGPLAEIGRASCRERVLDRV